MCALYFTKENIGSLESFFSFLKFTETITVLQKLGFVIFGSAVYDYIFRCAIDSISWKKYNSLKKLVQLRPICFNNINAFRNNDGKETDEDEAKLVELLKKICKCVHERVFSRKKFNSIELLLEFENPVSALPLFIELEIAVESLPVYPFNNEEIYTSISLDENGFTPFRRTGAFVILLEKEFNCNIENFLDPQIFGVLSQIGRKIRKNQYKIDTQKTAFEAAIRRFKAFQTKGYEVSAFFYGLSIQTPEVKFESEDCSICRESIGKDDCISHLACTHFFHVKCISKWLKRDASARCPLCRSAIMQAEVLRTFCS